MGDAIEQAAEALWNALQSGKACSPVRDLLAATDLEGAYAVQELNTERKLGAGDRLVGRKIGLTSTAVQKQLGVDRPDYGMLFADMAVADGAEFPAGSLIQPKVEAEVAFVLGRDLSDEQLTAADILRAIDFAIPAIEIVDSRIADWDIGIVDTIADNASSGRYVLGNEPRLLRNLNLRDCGAVLECRGEPLSTGAGAACLGHPVNATLWLANTMVRIGRPLRAGDTVLSGALGPMVPARPGEVYEARIEGLGSVRAAFSHG